MARPRTDSIDVPTPERLLAAAEQAFAERGYDAARLADIAERAGLRRPSLLYHFESKDALYAAVIARAFTRLGDALAAAREVPGDFETRLRAVAEAFATFLDREPRVARLVVRELLDPEGPGRPLLLEQAAPLLDAIEAWVREAGDGRLREAPGVRTVIMHVASDALLRNCAGPLQEPLWGSPRADPSWSFVRALLLSGSETS